MRQRWLMRILYNLVNGGIKFARKERSHLMGIRIIRVTHLSNSRRKQPLTVENIGIFGKKQKISRAMK